jgi:hypothetical protein
MFGRGGHPKQRKTYPFYTRNRDKRKTSVSLLKTCPFFSSPATADSGGRCSVRTVPSVAPGAVGRGGYGRSASSMLLRTSSDLVSAAARQSRRVAPAEVADATGSNLVPEPKAGAAAPKCQDSPGRSHPPPPALASIAAPCSALKLFAMRRR